MQKFVFIIMLILAIAGIGCHNHDHEHDTHSHDFKYKYTVYNTDYELFAETDQFIVGHQTNILSHFSRLSDFKPIEADSITLILINQGESVEETIVKSSRKGIYSFNLVALQAGTTQLVYKIYHQQKERQLVVPNVYVFANDDEAHHAIHEFEEPSEINTVSFTKEQSWKTDFATQTCTEGPFFQLIKTSARIHPAQGDEMVISAKTPGLIRFTSENIMEGKKVSSGQKLFAISGSGMSDNNANIRFIESQNKYERMNKEYERSKGLYADRIISEKDFLSVKNEYENAKAQFEDLVKNFNSSGQQVTCPLSGFISQVFVQNGQYVEAGQALAIVSQNQKLILHADVQQKFAPILGLISTATLRTLHNNQTYTLEELNGKILAFGRNANSDNHLIPVSLQIDNKVDFVPGGFVEVFLKSASPNKVLSIPNSALVEEQGVFFVFVQVNPELFQKREVKTGSSDGISTVIVKGLSAGERIVSKGAMLVKLAQAAGELDPHSGHVH
jgi:membrane fusion protein, heavy metal efflux system